MARIGALAMDTRIIHSLQRTTSNTRYTHLFELARIFRRRRDVFVIGGSLAVRRRGGSGGAVGDGVDPSRINGILCMMMYIAYWTGMSYDVVTGTGISCDWYWYVL